MFVLGDEHFEPDEYEWEKSHHVKEVVKKEVIDAVSAEGVKKPGETFVLYETGDEKVSRERCGAELENEKRSHKIGNYRRVKGQRQPEKRAEKKVKGVGADEIDAEVRDPVPAYLPGFHKLVGVHVKANLLAVVVAVICKNSAVSVNDEPDGGDCAKRSQKERHPVHILIHKFANICHLYFL